MIFIFRSLPYKADSRIGRNKELFSKVDSVCKTYCWEISTDVADAFPFEKNGNRFSKLIKYVLFVLWVPLLIFLNRRKLSAVVFMDLETALLGIPLAKLLRIPCVFDIVDPFSQTKLNFKIVDRLEVLYSKLASVTIIPHSSRFSFYIDRIGAKLPKSTLIIENVPDFRQNRPDDIERASITSKISRYREKIIIGYFGTLDKNSRGLEALIGFAENDPRIGLLIAGGGALSNYLSSYSGPANIEFVGAYNHSDLRDLFSRIDFSWAYYSPKIDLHKYAAPNKFYEHLFFKKPIITSSVIPQSKFVVENNTGIVIDGLENLDIYKICYSYLASIHAMWDKDFWSSLYQHYWISAEVRLSEIFK